MAQLRKNILANLAGQGWAALMQLIFIPVYVKYLGIEAYGLIGFYAVLQGILQILDLGLSPTMTRELARYSASPEKSGDSRRLVRTLETIYWGVGILIGLAIFFAAPLIADHWLHASSLNPNTVRTSLRLIAIIAALQWPLSFYQGGLLGLERLVLFNTLKIANSTVFGVGAALIIIFVSRDITAFFLWQAFASALNVGVVTVTLWKSLPRSDKTVTFDRRILHEIKTFAGGMTGVMITGIVVSQIDKVMVSKMLPLRDLGYYSVAYVLSNALILVILPISNALFPRFSALVASHDEKELSRLYHLGSQFLCALVLPLAAILALYSYDVLWLWTGNSDTAKGAFEIARFLVIGSALNGLTFPLQALQQANGWTSVGILFNVFFVVVLVPMIALLLPVYGAVGAAASWAFINLLYVIVNAAMTHRRLLKGQAGRWYTQDVGVVLVTVLILIIGTQSVVSSPPHSLVGALQLIGTCAVLFAAAVIAAPQLRPAAIDFVTRRVTPHA